MGCASALNILCACVVYICIWLLYLIPCSIHVSRNIEFFFDPNAYFFKICFLFRSFAFWEMIWFEKRCTRFEIYYLSSHGYLHSPIISIWLSYKENSKIKSTTLNFIFFGKCGIKRRFSKIQASAWVLYIHLLHQMHDLDTIVKKTSLKCTWSTASIWMLKWANMYVTAH